MSGISGSGLNCTDTGPGSFQGCRTCMIALSFCHISRKGKRPPDPAFPQNLITLGDHIRKRRLTLGLYRREVAQFIEVDGTTIYNWEAGHYVPFTRHLPKIYEFLGYCPMRYPKTIGEKLKLWRESLGLNQEQLAKRMGVDESSISEWETGRHMPTKWSLGKIKIFLENTFSCRRGKKEIVL